MAYLRRPKLVGVLIYRLLELEAVVVDRCSGHAAGGCFGAQSNAMPPTVTLLGAAAMEHWAMESPFLQNLSGGGQGRG